MNKWYQVNDQQETGVTCEARTVKPSGAPEFTTGI